MHTDTDTDTHTDTDTLGIEQLFLFSTDNRSLPFMAMLRNLRNMISQGISEKHHQKILARLTNKVSCP